MKATLISPASKILNIEKKTNNDGSINWTEVIFLSQNECNTLTCDNKTSELLKIGSIYDLIIKVTEQAKAYKNGEGAYIENKFRITGIVSK